MPFALLRAHMEMLPRLEAEETRRSINAMAIAFGSMKDDDAREYQRRLDAALGQERKPSPPHEALGAMRAMGVPVEVRRRA